jgi:GNAT superfamily N-acetyltransferase
VGPRQDHRRRPRAAPRARLPRLNQLLDRLAAGHAPPADASVAVLPAPLGARAVVVGGTAWHVVAADVDPSWVAVEVAHDPIAAPLGARFLTALADRIGTEPGVLDNVLVAAPAVSDLQLVPADVDHPRVERALLHRSDVRVWTTPEGVGLLTLGRGVAGRWEVSLEVEPACRGRGLGTALARAARSLVSAPLWAQVAPANVASLRAFLAAGYRPVGAEVLFGP